MVLEYFISKADEVFGQQSEFDEVYVGNGWLDSACEADESNFEIEQKQPNLECSLEFER